MDQSARHAKAKSIFSLGALTLQLVDAFHHLAGTVETPEKFEAHRLELAKRVWARMKETDSQECRHCHDIRAMDPEKQGKTAQKLASGERTCIEPTRNRPGALNPAMPWPTNLSSARRKLKTEACEF